MTIVQLVLKFAAAVCSPDLHTNGTLPYWTICTIVFDAVTLVSMAFGALDKTKVKKFLCWFSFVPMLLVEGFATSGKVAWEGWNAYRRPSRAPGRTCWPKDKRTTPLHTRVVLHAALHTRYTRASRHTCHTQRKLPSTSAPQHSAEGQATRCRQLLPSSHDIPREGGRGIPSQP
jgi:hypothetical protein